MKRNVLVVEDNDLNREMLTEILSDEYTVLQAENGQRALEILRGNENISLILLDVMMPVMDGYTFLRIIKADNELSLIPVIVMTQGDTEKDEIEALSNGATDFVPKPYRPKVILHRAASLIRLRETAAMVNQLKYDSLTGLYTKEYFYRIVKDILDEHPDIRYSIVCTNIESFKLYNDSYGRDAGDELLKKTARRMLEIIAPYGIGARISADRFLCLVKSSREDEFEDFRAGAGFANNFFNNNNTQIKWGVFEIKDRSIDVEHMCDFAEMAVNSIKGQYNTPYSLYDEKLMNKLLREKAITDSMEKALAGDQFEIYFQPKYDLKNECMSGAEALVRWQHPEIGFMSPGEFIPLFEKNGFISRLDNYVWDRTCRYLSEWQKQGIAAVPVSVNVSRADVFIGDLTDIFSSLVKKYDISPSLLHLEITESAYSENPAKIISAVEKLRSLGFVIEMDDFGSGYSSLNMLSQMSLDILKLDMSFIRNELQKPLGHSVLSDVIKMAHRMGLKVVAEGVETKEQVRRLKQVDCDYVQGYYFAKPMPAAQFSELISEIREKTSEDICRKYIRAGNKRYIIAADKDANFRNRIINLLGKDYHILEAETIGAVTELIEACSDADSLTVLINPALPGGDTADIIRKIRQNPAHWNIPILAVIDGPGHAESFRSLEAFDDFLCKAHPLFDVKRRVENMSELAFIRRRERLLQEEANSDPLTGLLNRRGFNAAIGRIKNEDYPIALYIFDLDNLKMINDRFGHDAGDRVITAFAEILKENTRVGDILCRYGGDEFVAVLGNINDKESVLERGNMICSLLRQTFEGDIIPAACSAGAVLACSDTELSQKLVDMADKALYEAKNHNKGTCRIIEV
ncbi:MAG: EAL domain-containing protein [Clostridiales bacterium]|nr:EAL domain-containing protein [Clostridiales bacterium]